MIIKSARLARLNIPFKMSFSHSKADRFRSDSVILILTGETSSGRRLAGYGEAVIRDYVSGKIDGDGSDGALSAAFERMLAPLCGIDITPAGAADILSALQPPEEQLPVLCAAETAVLDMACAEAETDIYGLLGRSPVRTVLTYSGTLPLLPPEAAEKLLGAYLKMGISSLRIKLDKSPDRNEAVLGLARRITGAGFDLRTDANAAWDREDLLANLDVLKRHGINLVEEPFGRDDKKNSCLAEISAETGINFMADESALTAGDIRKAAETGSFGVFNIRLAKNGGLLKALEMAQEADGLGLSYQAGCHVGETGILSAAGRTAASLMKAPLYTDGSYDSHLLEGNITAEDLGFGPGGLAPIITKKGCGFTVDQKQLERWKDEELAVF